MAITIFFTLDFISCSKVQSITYLPFIFIKILEFGSYLGPLKAITAMQLKFFSFFVIDLYILDRAIKIFFLFLDKLSECCL